MTSQEKELINLLREENRDDHRELKNCLETLNVRVRANEVRSKVNQAIITIVLLSSGGYGIFKLFEG